MISYTKFESGERREPRQAGGSAGGRDIDEFIMIRDKFFVPEWYSPGACSGTKNYPEA